MEAAKVQVMRMPRLILPSNEPASEHWKGIQLFVKPTERDISHRKLERLQRIGEIRLYYLRNPIRFIEDVFGATLFDYQKYCLASSWATPNVLWVCSRGAGKALDLNTRIPTPHGDKILRDIHVGDTIFGADGCPTKVIAESPIYFDHDCYKIRFSDGEEIIADAGHLWDVNMYGRRKTVTTTDIAKDVRRYRPRKDPTKNGWEYTYKVNIPAPMQYPEQQLPIDPYILGLWLGDGCAANSYITVDSRELDDLCARIDATGYTYRVRNDSNGNKRVCVALPDGTPLVTKLKELGLWQNKRIPDEYCYSSVEQRLSLIQGLMDTDGYIDGRNGKASLSQCAAHAPIIEKAAQILRSLGFKVSDSLVYKRCGGKKFPQRILHFCPDLSMPVVRMPRKLARLHPARPVNAVHKSIIAVEKTESVPVKCLVVDNKDHLFLCGKYNTVTHNSTLVDLDTMAKGMLLNNYHTYIASGSAQQSITTFQTLEKIANRNIESMTGLTNVFSMEVEITTGTGTGFIHNPAGYYYHLFNGSMTKTLNSNVDKQRGARGNRVVFDECGFLDDNLMNVFAAFTIVDKDLKVGGDVDAQSIATLPTEIPNQLFYISSASSVDTPFYKKFRDFTMQMIAGNPDYFVADLNCEVLIRPLMGGKVYPSALLKQETIDAEMRTNPEKGAREYYCRFTRDGDVGQIIKRALIVRNSEVRPPVLSNPDNTKQYALFYDPARTRDNSVVLICEVRHDKRKGWMLDVVNLVNFADLTLKKKTPKTTQQQIKDLKDLIAGYNGAVPDYQNIQVVMVDAGSGGGGNRIPDFLWEEWKDSKGVSHAGLIDPVYSADYVRLYKGAIDILKMVNPAMKSEMFEALIRMVESDLITFPEEYDNRGYLTMLDVDQKLIERETSRIKNKLNKESLSEEEFNTRLNEELEKLDSIKTRMYSLSPEEEIALKQIDAMKTEIVNICRTKRESGKDVFKLPAHKDATTGASEGALHDDRAYVLAMAGWWLSELRRTDQLKKAKDRQKNSASMKTQFLKVRAPKKVGAFI